MTGNATLPSSAYLHVPFCTRRCSYCDFAVQAVSEPPTAEWLGAIQAELDLLTGERGWAVPLHLDTLYVGGGTPSLLGREAMDLLADRIRPYLSWDAHEVEWSCEANPESFSLAVAEGWRRAGVNRISLGVQTFHVPALSWMGRLHGPEGAVEAVRAARAAGFDNLSVDLIFGLPDHLDRDLEVDLARVLALEPEHVSLYGLTAEPAAPLGRWVAEGRERMPDEDRYADEFLLAHERLTGAGYRHYEVSNFARGDRESRHNRVYWSGSPYIGLGSGAHAYYPPLRRWNTRSWSAYRDSVRNGRLPIEGEETVTAEGSDLESIWLGLRTDQGYSLDGAPPARLRSAEEWVRRGWGTVVDGVLTLTAEGWLRLDRLAVEMASAGASPGDRSRRRQASGPTRSG